MSQWSRGQFVSGASWLSRRSILAGDIIIGGVPFPTGQGGLQGCAHRASLLTHKGGPVPAALDREESVRNGRRVPGSLPRLLPAALCSVLQSKFVQKPCPTRGLLPCAPGSRAPCAQQVSLTPGTGSPSFKTYGAGSTQNPAAPQLGDTVSWRKDTGPRQGACSWHENLGLRGTPETL